MPIFNLKFFGYGNGFSKNLINTSAYFKELDKLLVIDCGETVIRQIIDNTILQDIKEVYFLFTHTHSDHVGSLGTTIFYLFFIKKIKVNLILSYDLFYCADILNLLKIFGVTPDMYSIISVKTLVYRFNSIKSINLIQNKHVSEIPSYSIKIIDQCDFSYYYTGDSCDYEMIKRIINDKSLKRAYIDCSISEREEKTHLQLNMLSKIISPNVRKKFCCMHFISKEAIKKCKELGFKVAKSYT